MSIFRWSLLFLFCISPELLAASISDGNIDTGLFSIPLEDRSLFYLSKLFGTVHGTLINFSTPENQFNGQLFSNIFNIFNIILMTFGVLLITYSNILTGVANGSQGSALGQKWSSPWLAFRATISFALLAPFNHGYSIAQTLLMSLIIQGIGLANGVWDIALDYYESGYQLASMDNHDIFGNDSPYVLEQIAEQAFCAAYYNEYYAPKDESTEKPLLKAHIWPAQLPPQPSKDTQVHFAVGTQPSSGSTHLSQSNQICGRMAIKLKDIPIQNNISAQSEALYDILSAYQTMYDYYYTMAYESLIKSLDAMGPDDPSLKAAHAALALADSQPISNAFINIDGPALFRQALQTADHTIRQANLAKKRQEDYQSGAIEFSVFDPAQRIEQSRREGWLFAASFYSALQSQQTSIQNLSVTLPMEFKYSANEAALDGLISMNGVEWAETANQLYFNHSSQSVPDIDDQTSIKSIHFSDRATSPLSTDAPKFDRFSKVMLSNLATRISEKFMTRMTEGAEASRIDPETGKAKYVDPIASMQALGYDLLHSAEWAMNTSIIIAFVSALFSFIFSAANPMKDVIDTLLSFMFAFVSLFLVVTVAPGCLLAAYLPMIPFYLFLFATVSWLILCIEGMVAIPLSILSMSLPGQGILGKGTPGITLAISIALRPTLMVLGFLLGAKLLMAVFTMWNYAAQATIMSVWGSSLGLFSIPMVLALYTGVAMILAQQSWSLIYNVPDKTCAWIGHQIERTNVARLAQESEQKAEEGAQQAGTMAKGVLNSTQEQAKKANQSSSNDQDSDDSAQESGDSSQQSAPPPQ